MPLTLSLALRPALLGTGSRRTLAHLVLIHGFDGPGAVPAEEVAGLPLQQAGFGAAAHHRFFAAAVLLRARGERLPAAVRTRLELAREAPRRVQRRRGKGGGGGTIGGILFYFFDHAVEEALRGRAGHQGFLLRTAALQGAGAVRGLETGVVRLERAPAQLARPLQRGPRLAALLRRGAAILVFTAILRIEHVLLAVVYCSVLEGVALSAAATGGVSFRAAVLNTHARGAGKAPQVD